MPLHVRDQATTDLVRTLAKRRNIGLTEAIKMAVSNELERDAAPLRERLADLRRKVAAHGKTGLAADKAFFDDLSGEP